MYFRASNSRANSLDVEFTDVERLDIELFPGTGGWTMGLDVYVKNFARYDIDHFGDKNGSFAAACAGAPWTSLRRGVHPNGHTLFNSIQLRRLVEELQALPSGDKTVGVSRVLDAAQLAIRNSGYLLFVGD